MCGIAGYMSFDGSPVPKEPIEPMLISIRHRGPDGFGAYIGDSCVLGHARLSIIDLEGGWQPLFNEDRRLAVTFNGEIYNYIELRQELESKGHRFRTRSDTEVIVHAYEEWGPDCPKRFNGQFAFAVHDSEARALFLCRDRLGVRPLYYASDGKVFVFASEVKSLISSGFVAPRLSPAGFDQIFTFWTNVFPDTPFENIFELPPAHTMAVTEEGASLARYWRFPIRSEDDRPAEEWEERTIEHLTRSIRLRLRADVPVGAYLSGGLDSALTTTLVRRVTGAPLKTFSLEFEDPRFDESPYQRHLVRFLETEHASIRCRPEDIVENFEAVIWAVERPILRTAPVPMFMLSRLVRSEGYKVVITGEGADEFFLGYDIFKEAKVRDFCGRRPESKFRPLLLRRLYPYLFGDRKIDRFQEAFFLQHAGETQDPFYGHRIRWNLNRKISDFYSKEMSERIEHGAEESLMKNLPDEYPSCDIGLRTQIVEIETLLSGYLLSSQGDRVAMAHSVEGRFAFLDHELIEFASRMPSRLKMAGLREKAILKRIGKALLPQETLARHKFPYRAPDIDSFLRTSAGREVLRRELSADRVKEAGIFDPLQISKVLDLVMAKPGKDVTMSVNLALMAALSGQMIYRKFVKEKMGRESFAPLDKVRWLRGGDQPCHRKM